MTDAAPAGAPLAATIDGLLDGRIGDLAQLRAATEALGRVGAGAFACEVQGGRFTLLPRTTALPPGAFDEAAQARFLAALQDVLAAALPGSVESNLRCRLVYADEVAETLFVVRGADAQPLTRRRPRTAEDAVALPAPAPARPFGLRPRELGWVAPAVLALAALFAWRNGWIDRALAARAEQLQIDAGPFAGLVVVAAERTWGNYRVELRRGASFPATPQVVGERQTAAGDAAVRTALGVVGDGRELYVQLVDAKLEVLAESRAELRALLTAPDAVVAVELPGRMGAERLRLALVPAPARK